MESFLFRLDLLTDHELDRLALGDVGSSVTVVSYGALCPEGRMVPMADICTFW